MRERILTLLGVVAVGVGSALAQPNPPFPMQTSPPSAPAAPAGNPYGVPWDRAWEAIVLSACSPQPRQTPPPPEPEPDSSANRFWFASDYLVWWSKSGPMPQPLVTTGPTITNILGGLTEPGTHVLFGGTSEDYGTTSGLRLDTGYWVDEERRWALEAGFFFLEQRSQGFSASSNAHGSPLIALPLIDPATGREFTEVIALPRYIDGGVAITTHSHLQGWELNGLANIGRGDHFSFDVLAGLRVLKLDEDLQVSTSFSPLVDEVLSFQGQLVNPPSHLATYDDFQSQNQFYGFQLGGRLEWTYGDWTIRALGKVALGGTQELERVVGGTALLTPGMATRTAAGGIYAVASNIGRHFQDDFAAVPEANLQISYRLTRHLEAQFGYSFLYWSSVARPGNQISRSVPPGQIPIDPLFRTTAVPATPFQIHSSDYWAQGLNFGMTLHF